MSDFETLEKKQQKILVLVGLNFVLFMILFAGLGYVTWKSAVLVNRLEDNLNQAEETIAQLQTRFQQMDTDVIVERLVKNASDQISESVRQVVRNTDIALPITEMSEKLIATQEKFEKTSAALAGIHETVSQLDNEEISKYVSYYILKELGQGLQNAAEKNKPEATNTTKENVN
jgi:hypothetical protein